MAMKTGARMSSCILTESTCDVFGSYSIETLVGGSVWRARVRNRLKLFWSRDMPPYSPVAPETVLNMRTCLLF